ncbi:MAG: hypothetical protein HQL10_12300 [Nitrospirae bacterium]|nr:hypothetical protein [Nitrospirota bacterium]
MNETGGNGGGASADQSEHYDTGLHCLVLIAKYNGVAADAAQIKHAFAIGSSGMNGIEIVRVAM